MRAVGREERRAGAVGGEGEEFLVDAYLPVVWDVFFGRFTLRWFDGRISRRGGGGGGSCSGGIWSGGRAGAESEVIRSRWVPLGFSTYILSSQCRSPSIGAQDQPPHVCAEARCYLLLAQEVVLFEARRPSRHYFFF